MPDFSKMSITEIGNYLHELHENASKLPFETHVKNIAETLSAYSKSIDNK